MGLVTGQLVGVPLATTASCTCQDICSQQSWKCLLEVSRCSGQRLREQQHDNINRFGFLFGWRRMVDAHLLDKSC